MLKKCVLTTLLLLPLCLFGITPVTAPAFLETINKTLPLTGKVIWKNRPMTGVYYKHLDPEPAFKDDVFQGLEKFLVEMRNDSVPIQANWMPGLYLEQCNVEIGSTYSFYAVGLGYTTTISGVNGMRNWYLILESEELQKACGTEESYFYYLVGYQKKVVAPPTWD